MNSPIVLASMLGQQRLGPTNLRILSTLGSPFADMSPEILAALTCTPPLRRGFQFTALDTKYARVLKKSHPGSRLVLLTDMDTQFDFDGVEDIEVGMLPHTLPCCTLMPACSARDFSRCHKPPR